MAKRPVQVPGGDPSAFSQDQDQTDAGKGSVDNPLTDADAQADLQGEPRPAAEPVKAAKGQKAAKAAEPVSDEDYREKARGLRAADVDATRLRRAVLTLDGWVCPANSPAPPAKE
jgi:hypothetical protein